MEGEDLSLFIDGKCVQKLKSSHSSVSPKTELLVGAMAKDSGNFQGRIAKVQLFDHVIDESQIEALFRSGLRKFASTSIPTENTSCSVSAKARHLGATESGAVLINADGRKYYLASAYASPGASIAWHSLGISSQQPAKLWAVSSRQLDPVTLEITATSDQYSLRRQVRLDAGAIGVTDTYTGKSDDPLASSTSTS